MGEVVDRAISKPKTINKIIGGINHQILFLYKNRNMSRIIIPSYLDTVTYCSRLFNT